MAFGFEDHHGAMLLKYSGISFISGAVNHGFFSGERSLWTAAIGVVLFVLGALMEHRLTDSLQEKPGGLLRTLILGTLLSIGLGFFTGGLQHFPDSPARSAWVVPLGFVLSVPALALQTPLDWRRSSTAYAVVAGVLVGVGSYGAWKWLEQNPQHAPGHSHAEGPAVLTALTVDRSVEIRMDDRMRFTPDRLEVQTGETVRLVVHNDGQVPHELVLGTEAEIQTHAQLMKNAASHGHDHAGAAAVSVAPGQTGELVVRFAQAADLQMACLVPGHYEAGMRGALKVSDRKNATGAPSQTMITARTSIEGSKAQPRCQSV